MIEKWVANGKRPLPLVWDRAATYIPVGDNYDIFIREASDYIWRDIPLDKKSWAEVPEDQKNGLWEHLRVNYLYNYISFVDFLLLFIYLTFFYLQTYFDFDSLKNDPDGRALWEGIECQVGKRYRGRKSTANDYFGKNGGVNDVERARANPPGV